jgi:hypothetical protein
MRKRENVVNVGLNKKNVQDEYETAYGVVWVKAGKRYKIHNILNKST